MKRKLVWVIAGLLILAVCAITIFLSTQVSPPPEVQTQQSTPAQTQKQTDDTAPAPQAKPTVPSSEIDAVTNDIDQLELQQSDSELQSELNF